MPSRAKPQPGQLTREVGAILRARMVRQGDTLADLSAGVTVSVAQLSKMLRGRAHIDIEQFDAICSFLGLDSALVWEEATRDVRHPMAESGARPASLHDRRIRRSNQPIAGAPDSRSHNSEIADREVAENIETGLRFARAMEEAGVIRVAARGELTPEALRAITEIVTRRIGDD
jgi:transcriptional regulator with XRE-family HTH domain